MATDAHQTRSRDAGDAPIPPILADPPVDRPRLDLKVARYANAIFKLISISIHPRILLAISVRNSHVTQWFVASWSYYRRIYLWKGSVRVSTFSLQLPGLPVLLTNLLKDIPCIIDRDEHLDEQNKRVATSTAIVAPSPSDLVLHQIPLRWLKDCTARVVDEHATQTKLVLQKIRKVRIAPAPGGGGDGGDDDADDDDALNPDDLEAMLEAIIEEGLSEDEDDTTLDVDVVVAADPAGGVDDTDEDEQAEPAAGLGAPEPPHVFDDEVLRHLQGMHEAAVAELASALDARTQAQHHAPSDSSVSMVSNGEGDVQFVYWQQAASRLARPVRIRPEDSSVVAIVWYAVPVDSYIGWTIELPRVPANVVKRKKSDAPDKMPRWCLLLRRFVSAQHNSGPIPFAATPLGMSCPLCSARDAADTDVDKATEAAIPPVFFCCSQCALVWHHACSRRLEPSSLPEPDADGDYALPGLFRCPLCMGQ